jgi:hypothetical protein
MGFFDRWRRRGRRLERLEAPWGERPSIYDDVRAHVRPDGSLPPEYVLPDEPEPDGSRIQWAAGALDGVLSHHMGGGEAGEEARRAAEIVTRTLELVAEPSDARLAALAALLEEPLLGCADAIVKELAARGDQHAEGLHALGRFLATRAADREAVKLGLLLLGLVQGTDDGELLATLGAHDELALFAIVATLNRPDLGERDLWTIAKRARGWGRVQAVERLAGTTDPAIQAWLLREGFRNEVMDEYLAYTCAVTGRLHEALAADDVDEALLAGAAGILAALARGGPAEDLSDYEHGPRVSERFLALLEARAEVKLELLPAVAALGSFVDEAHDGDALEGWTPAVRARVREAARRILGAAGVRERVEDALDSAVEEERRLGEHLAELLGIDTWARVQARLERTPVDPHAWSELMRQCDEERIDVALGLAERLPLDTIATGPADSLGLGLEYAPHTCLDVIVQDLGRYPGRGWPLVEAALQSPVIRNRNMALRALASWPRAAWPEEATAVLSSARAREPLEEVRARIDDVLAGREPR